MKLHTPTLQRFHSKLVSAGQIERPERSETWESADLVALAAACFAELVRRRAVKPAALTGGVDVFLDRSVQLTEQVIREAAELIHNQQFLSDGWHELGRVDAMPQIL